MRDFVFQPPFGVQTIKKIIPHRIPFLLVDGITELSENEVRGFKNLAANEPVFAGHFPNEPVYPGVLHIETMAQVGACWILAQRENLGKIAYLMTIETCKFRKPAVPGDRLDIHGTITNLRSRTGRISGTLSINGEVASELALMFAFQKPKDS